MNFTNNKPQLKNIRQKLRKEMPKSERLIWQKIKNNQLGIKFRRQFSIDNFILDFYSPKIKLGIEIDGDSHFISNKELEKDKNRDKILFEKYKIKILRFSNLEVKESMDDCIKIILKNI